LNANEKSGGILSGTKAHQYKIQKPGKPEPKQERIKFKGKLFMKDGGWFSVRKRKSQ